MSNPFASCSNDTEIMKALFELNASKAYTREELIKYSQERRAELEEVKDDFEFIDLDITRVLQPLKEKYFPNLFNGEPGSTTLVINDDGSIEI